MLNQPLTGTASGALKGIVVGNRTMTASSGPALTGSVAEVMVYNSDLSNVDVNLIGNYLGSKWAITWTNL